MTNVVRFIFFNCELTCGESEDNEKTRGVRLPYLWGVRECSQFADIQLMLGDDFIESQVWAERVLRLGSAMG